MTGLREAVAWCADLAVPWSSDDVAAMSGADPKAVLAYLRSLAGTGVLIESADGWMAGAMAAAWRAKRPKTHPGGRSRDYVRAKAARDRLLEIEGRARREGRLRDAPYHPEGNGRDNEEQKGIETTMQPMITVKTASSYLAMHPKTIARWCKAGRIKGARKIGSDWKIPEATMREMTA